jgi:hypothetical protein
LSPASVRARSAHLKRLFEIQASPMDGRSTLVILALKAWKAFALIAWISLIGHVYDNPNKTNSLLTSRRTEPPPNVV